MSTDSTKKEPKETKESDLWRIPKILSIEVLDAHFRSPMPYFIKSQQVDIGEAIEFLVRTSEDFPVRALSPALFVGDFVVMDVSRVSENLYRFFVPEPDIKQLKLGAPISIGWAGVKAKRVRTKFRFRVGREESR
jgi:hypothetical protein